MTRIITIFWGNFTHKWWQKITACLIIIIFILFYPIPKDYYINFVISALSLYALYLFVSTSLIYFKYLTEIKTKAYGIDILYPVGVLSDDAQSSGLHAEIKGLIQDGTRRIIVNLKKVDWITQAGIKLLADSLLSAQENNAQIKFSAPKKRSKIILLLFDSDYPFDIHLNNYTAFRSFKKTDKKEGGK